MTDRIDDLVRAHADRDDVEHVLPPDTTLLDLVDNLLDKGLLVHGELVIGLAGVDLVYVGLSAMICAADRLLPETRRKPR
ncbi:gas vesicle protein GvpJ [Sandaracinus amylolyticus]|nr:gas vesicle protein GvpJ [Sandaracinus amylolyticus]